MASTEKLTADLAALEEEAIFVLRETVAEFENPVLLYSVGKDSSVLLRLSQKAFFPGPIPYPLMHIDTGYKFPQMYEFRDRMVRELGARLLVERNEEWIEKGCHPDKLGRDQCCQHLKTEALLRGLRKHRFDAAVGGARRDEEKSRAKERFISIRDPHGQWEPRDQRPEPWRAFNCALTENQTARVFPLSNWTELDVWRYIRAESIPVVPMYFSRTREMLERDGMLVPADSARAEEKPVRMQARYRSLGCTHCTGAVASCAKTVEEILTELETTRTSERANRLIDFSSDSAMEEKKKRGYF